MYAYNTYKMHREGTNLWSVSQAREPYDDPIRCCGLPWLLNKKDNTQYI